MRIAGCAFFPRARTRAHENTQKQTRTWRAAVRLSSGLCANGHPIRSAPRVNSRVHAEMCSEIVAGKAGIGVDSHAAAFARTCNDRTLLFLEENNGFPSGSTYRTAAAVRNIFALVEEKSEVRGFGRSKWPPSRLDEVCGDARTRDGEGRVGRAVSLRVDRGA